MSAPANGVFAYWADLPENMPAQDVTVTAVYASTLDTPTGLQWSATEPGKAQWTSVADATGYSVQLYKDGTALGSPMSVTSAEADFPATITANGPGSYTFTVQAVGDGVLYLNSAVSGPSAVYNYAVAPSAPQNFTATAGDGEVTLSWTAPASDGGAAITGYEVSKDDGESWESADSDTGHVFTGLTNGQSYTFKVRAVNSAGAGAEAAVTATPLATYIDRELEDASTSITVSGTIHREAVLTVSDMALHDDDPACDEIRQRMNDDDYVLLLGKEISLSQDFVGFLTITIPVGTRYNRDVVTILHCDAGDLQTYTATVTDGKAVFRVTSLSPFAVFADADDDIPGTGDSSAPWVWWLLCGVSAAGVITLSVLKKCKNADKR